MNIVQKTIKELCDEKNIKFDIVSKDWVMILNKDGKTRYIMGFKFNLNNHAVGEICDDKFALYEVLKFYNIPIAEYNILFKNYNPEEVLEYAKKNHYNLVVKSNIGTCGKNMFHVTDEASLLEHIDELLVNNHAVCVCPFYEIKNEYRTVILDGNVELFYGKKRPVVIGDGIKTIYELLCDFNHNYFSKKHDETLDVVLKKGEEFVYNWQHNLSKGAIPFEVEDEEIKEKVQRLAKEAFNKLNLRFASIDVIELISGEFLILEINSGMMIKRFAEFMPNGEKICKEIYSKAIDKMFE